MKNKNKHKHPDDDGRVIAAMNVDGMPWYTPVPKIGRNAYETPKPDIVNTDTGDTALEPLEMTRMETAAFTWGVLRAALLVAFVFIGALFLFIMFCIYVWFR